MAVQPSGFKPFPRGMCRDLNSCFARVEAVFARKPVYAFKDSAKFFRETLFISLEFSPYAALISGNLSSNSSHLGLSVIYTPSPKVRESTSSPRTPPCILSRWKAGASQDSVCFPPEPSEIASLPGIQCLKHHFLHWVCVVC